MFDNLSLPHLLMVVVVVLFLFGPKRIPEIAASMGKGISEFRKNIAARGDLPPSESEETRAPGSTDAPTTTTEGRAPKRLLR